jgi:hypothetical protein
LDVDVSRGQCCGRLLDPSLGRLSFLDANNLKRMGTASPDDRRRMNRQAAALRDLEISEAGDDEQRAAAIDEANDDRRRLGLDELKTETEFHRKAVQRGLVRR